jgi:catechol 2,3-dioxygenase-like lactoylglutathione lyase family enzyme
MPLLGLDHYFVRVRDLERSRSFYCDVLGFEVMPRPAFPFPGYWLGVGGRVQVHMGPDDLPEAPAFYLGTSPDSARTNAGVVDHIAFQAVGPEEVGRRLQGHGRSYRTRYFPPFALFQIFVADPDGLMIELNFAGIGEEPSWPGKP